jgi:hypothetical protein
VRVRPARIPDEEGRRRRVNELPGAEIRIVVDELKRLAAIADRLLLLGSVSTACVTGGGVDAPENLAVTDFAVLSVTVQVVFVPAQLPLQPRKDAPASGVAVNVTFAPALKCWTQVFCPPEAAHFPREVETVPAA